VALCAQWFDALNWVPETLFLYWLQPLGGRFAITMTGRHDGMMFVPRSACRTAVWSRRAGQRTDQGCCVLLIYDCSRVDLLPFGFLALLVIDSSRQTGNLVIGGSPVATWGPQLPPWKPPSVQEVYRHGSLTPATSDYNFHRFRRGAPFTAASAKWRNAASVDLKTNLPATFILTQNREPGQWQSACGHLAHTRIGVLDMRVACQTTQPWPVLGPQRLLKRSNAVRG